MDFENPWTLASELSEGQSLQIAQAWKKHEDDRRRISKSPRQILEVMTSEHFKEMESFMNVMRSSYQPWTWTLVVGRTMEVEFS